MIAACAWIHSSENILRISTKKLYLVDPYIPYWQHKTKKSRFVTHYIDNYHEAIERLEPYEDKYVLLKMDSNQAVNQIWISLIGRTPN